MFTYDNPDIHYMVRWLNNKFFFVIHSDTLPSTVFPLKFANCDQHFVKRWIETKEKKIGLWLWLREKRKSMFRTRVRNGLFRKQLAKSRLNKERANLSFFFVVMFFAVFGIIVLTEVLLIDEKGRNQGLNVRKGFGDNFKYGERSDYDDQVRGN